MPSPTMVNRASRMVRKNGDSHLHKTRAKISKRGRCGLQRPMWKQTHGITLRRPRHFMKHFIIAIVFGSAFGYGIIWLLS